MSDKPTALHERHRVIECKDAGRLDEMLANDVISVPLPCCSAEGKTITTLYLIAALVVPGPTRR